MSPGTMCVLSRRCVLTLGRLKVVTLWKLTVLQTTRSVRVHARMARSTSAGTVSKALSVSFYAVPSVLPSPFGAFDLITSRFFSEMFWFTMDASGLFWLFRSNSLIAMSFCPGFTHPTANES